MSTENKIYNYQVFVINMFDYDDSWMDKEYDTCEEVLARAKHIVLRSFSKRGNAGYEYWLRFGESASIIVRNKAESIEFSAQDFVKEICGIR